MLRHPSYKGLRGDKSATAVVREVAESAPAKGKQQVTIEGRDLTLSNLGKVLYPKSKTTKGDVIAFYTQIAPVLLPHLHDRPITFNRFPDGIEGKHFYEKRRPSHKPDWVKTATVPSERHKTIEYSLLNDLPSLLWSVNLANLEMHPMLYKAPEVDNPTMVMFDLDPGKPADLASCADVALMLHGMFERLGLQSFAKTSGSKGIQLAVPLNDAEVTFADTKAFSSAVAATLEEARPELIIAKQAKAARKGKVLVDWSQNDEHKTTVSVHSLRAKTDPPLVSTPITWDEVSELAEERDVKAFEFSPAEALERIERHGDLWADVLTLRQSLPKGT
jgi:bifunctional non-homologous end joining protein LigD